MADHSEPLSESFNDNDSALLSVINTEADSGLISTSRIIPILRLSFLIHKHYHMTTKEEKI